MWNGRDLLGGKEVPDGFDDVWKGEKNLDSIMLCLTKNKQEKRNHDV
jgi:hypothetical protein